MISDLAGASQEPELGTSYEQKIYLEVAVLR